MLNIIIGREVEGKISYSSNYFNRKHTVDWLNNPLAKEIIKGIDNSVHIKDNLIESPVLGAIPPRMLSTGCKGVLILLNMPSGIIISGERFGDNCFPWLSRVGEEKDIYISLAHSLDDYDMQITAKIVNNGRIIHNSFELNREFLFVSQGFDSSQILGDD